VQIFGPEHLLRPVTPWSCSAAPIREPDTGAILGVLDLTGGPEVAGPQTLALVRATVAAVEAELRISRLVSPSVAAAGARDSSSTLPRLEVLGRRSALFSYPGTTTELSLRHSEIMLLLATSADGLSSAELGVALSDDDQAMVTIRAELSRLRSQLGPFPLHSRPYRLPRLSTDVDDLRADLAAGRLRQAVARYRGPVLPASRAPGVEQLREDLHRQLRGRLLAGDDPDALLAFADTPYGREDFDVWSRALAVLSPSSSRLPEVTEHLVKLDLGLR